MDILTSKTNEKIRSAVAVRDSSKTRRESKTFFLEGARLCSDAAENGIAIYRTFLSRTAQEKYGEYCKRITAASGEVYGISDEVAAKLSDTQNSQGIFCICRAEKSAQGAALNKDGRYLMLENVQDPSNLGAISRTAEALGIDGLIVCGGCDIYNPKALRASMGSALRMNIISRANAVETINEANENGMLTLASTPDKNSVKITEINMTGGTVCVVGNEGNGVTQETMNACRMRVTIPMGGRAESLNAGTAAAILIWEMVRE